MAARPVMSQGRWRVVLPLPGLLLLTAAILAAARFTQDVRQSSGPVASSDLQNAQTSVATAGLRVGDRAPDFEAPLLRAGGGSLRLSDLRGKAVVLNFWASWCVPCRSEARDLEAAHHRYQARGLTFLGVDIQQDDWDDAMAFVKEFGITYPTVRDVTGKITTMYLITSIPVTYFVDRSGIVRDRYLGPFLHETGQRELARRVEALLR